MATESSKLAPIIATAAKRFATARDIHTVGDLLAFWPRRYRTRESDLGSVVPGEYLVGVAEVKAASTRPMTTRKGTMLNVVITDGTHDIDITFFKAWGHEKALVPGARGIFAGVVGTYNNRLQLTHPGYTMLDDFDAGDRKDLIPIYRAVGSLHVRLTAPLDTRIARVRSKTGLSESEAESRIAVEDRVRAEMSRILYQWDPHTDEYYDLVINTGTVPYEQVVDTIVGFYRSKYPETAPPSPEGG